MSEPVPPTTEIAPLDATNPSSSLLFGFRGRIGRRGYWIGIAVMIALLLVAVMFAAAAMNPTGGGAPVLAVPLFFAALWVHAAVTVKRVRDMGVAVGLYLVIVVLFLVTLYAAIEFGEVTGGLSLTIPVFILAAPGILDKKAAGGESPLPRMRP